jgi:DNA-binding CsgD family transcriptional regulator
MKAEPKVINISRISGFLLDPTLTIEEAIILRALVAGKTDKEVCKDLRMSSGSFLRMMRDLWEKTGTANNLSLVVWAQRRMKNCDQRGDRHGDMHALRCLKQSLNNGLEDAAKRLIVLRNPMWLHSTDVCLRRKLKRSTAKQLLPASRRQWRSRA